MKSPWYEKDIGFNANKNGSEYPLPFLFIYSLFINIIHIYLHLTQMHSLSKSKL